MQSNTIKFFITTYTNFSHNTVIAYLSSGDAQYQYEVSATEQLYSKFCVWGTLELFSKLRELSDRGDGVVFTLEYGDQ